MFWTAVPETTIHKERHPLPLEHKIRPHPETSDFGFRTSDFNLPPPAGDPVRAQQPRQRQFRVPVAATANSRHHLGPLRLGENTKAAGSHPRPGWWQMSPGCRDNPGPARRGRISSTRPTWLGGGQRLAGCAGDYSSRQSQSVRGGPPWALTPVWLTKRLQCGRASVCGTARAGRCWRT